jgi:hypothetical protein
MYNVEQAGAAFADARLSAGTFAEAIANSEGMLAPSSHDQRLPARIYGIMAATTLVTFATLTAGYQLLFSNQVFA